MLRTLRTAEYFELLVLFFIQGAAMAIWLVPLGPILDAHGLHAIKPFAFAGSAVAAFISPLMFGAMADRRVPPAIVLRWLALATAVSMCFVSIAIQTHCQAWFTLLLIQVFYFSYSPMFSISSALIFSRLRNAQKEFGPIRSLATIGWLTGALLVSALNLDTSAGAGFLGATVWLLVAGITFFLPVLEIPKSIVNLTWHERLGLDALTLLKKRDTRVIFLTTTLFTIPIAAFYPFAPAHLRDLGLTHTSAWMSLAQGSEVIAMFSLGWLLLNWRLKWIIAAGLGFGVLRFTLSALNTKAALLSGIFLHGASYTLVFVTAQIYLEQRIDPAWRARAQALLSLMNGGVGNLIGYLGTGWWFSECARTTGTHWTIFWGGLALAVGCAMIYFLMVYRGQVPGTFRANQKQ
jgi:MFS family permease